MDAGVRTLVEAPNENRPNGGGSGQLRGSGQLAVQLHVDAAERPAALAGA